MQFMPVLVCIYRATWIRSDARQITTGHGDFSTQWRDTDPGPFATRQLLPLLPWCPITSTSTCEPFSRPQSCDAKQQKCLILPVSFDRWAA